jgi:hypothetical protein
MKRISGLAVVLLGAATLALADEGKVPALPTPAIAATPAAAAPAAPTQASSRAPEAKGAPVKAPLTLAEQQAVIAKWRSDERRAAREIMAIQEETKVQLAEKARALRVHVRGARKYCAISDPEVAFTLVDAHGKPSFDYTITVTAIEETEAKCAEISRTFWQEYVEKRPLEAIETGTRLTMEYSMKGNLLSGDSKITERAAALSNYRKRLVEDWNRTPGGSYYTFWVLADSKP